MIRIPVERNGSLQPNFPTDLCCNCGTTQDLSLVRTEMKQSLHLGVSGEEYILRFELPYCPQCAGTAKQPKPGAGGCGVAALLACFYGVAFIVVLALTEDGYQAINWVFPFTAVMTAASLWLIFGVVYRKRGNQTTPWQPVRMGPLKQEFVSGRVEGVSFVFSNAEYRARYEANNQNRTSGNAPQTPPG